MLIFGAFILLLGTVVARPYCRFLCPYGVLLNWMSRLSKWHLTITPSECINCRLCETSCPFGAINLPTEEKAAKPHKKNIQRLVVLLLLFPLILFGSGWIVSKLNIPLAKQHVSVALAEEIALEDAGERIETTEETRAFRASGKPTDQLFAEARAIQHQFSIGGWILGGFLGLVFSLKMISLSVRRKRAEYTADTGTCLSCGRCFSYCPVGESGIESSLIEDKGQK
jgi:ferredoxin